MEIRSSGLLPRAFTLAIKFSFSLKVQESPYKSHCSPIPWLRQPQRAQTTREPPGPPLVPALVLLLLPAHRFPPPAPLALWTYFWPSFFCSGDSYRLSYWAFYSHWSSQLLPSVYQWFSDLHVWRQLWVNGESCGFGKFPGFGRVFSCYYDFNHFHLLNTH